MRRLILGFVALISAPATAHAAPAEPAGARAFITRVYAEYTLKAEKRKEFTAFFDPGLRKLVQEDVKAAGPGNAPALDYDPICQCQDDTGLKLRILSIAGGPAQAVVHVENSYSQDPQTKPIPVTYTLVKVGGAWRIADIGIKDIPSLRAWLKRQIQEERG